MSPGETGGSLRWELTATMVSAFTGAGRGEAAAAEGARPAAHRRGAVGRADGGAASLWRHGGGEAEGAAAACWR